MHGFVPEKPMLCPSHMRICLKCIKTCDHHHNIHVQCGVHHTPSHISLFKAVRKKKGGGESTPWKREDIKLIRPSMNEWFHSGLIFCALVSIRCNMDDIYVQHLLGSVLHLGKVCPILFLWNKSCVLLACCFWKKTNYILPISEIIMKQINDWRHFVQVVTQIPKLWSQLHLPTYFIFL